MNKSHVRNPIAIVGMACHLPGAGDLDAYWDLLRRGGDAVTEMPADRLDRRLYHDPRKGIRGRTYSTIGGLVDERPTAETERLLSPTAYGKADPCHRYLCEVGVAACRNAGYQPEDLAGSNIGVFVGHSAGSSASGAYSCGSLAGYVVDRLRDVPAFESLPEDVREGVLVDAVGRLQERWPQRDATGGPELDAHRAASLVSQALGLTGPHLVVDAACASSLVALALACQAIEDEQVEAAIVGGASYNKFESLVLFSHAQSCTASGSKPFDAEADGLVSSEGYVAIVAKRLDKAIADGDEVLAVIRGLGLSSDGRGRSLWAPRKEGQVEALRRAYGPDIDPGRIDYVEAHATSTQVGDATEIEALAEFFGPIVGERRIPIGSVKSNIGHSLETAGLASLLKVVLAIRNGVIPPTINVTEPNRTVDWESNPFEIATTATTWSRRDGRPRCGGVNAFGIGGINAHVVVEEYVRESSPIPAKPRDTRSEIAVVGRGVVLPGVKSIEGLDAFVKNGVSAIGEPDDRWRNVADVLEGSLPRPLDAAARRGGFIRDYEYDWRTYKIPPKQIQNANPLQFMLLDAVTQALHEAGYDEAGFDRVGTGVVIGGEFGGDFGNELAIGLRIPELRDELDRILHERGLPPGSRHELLDEYEEQLLRTYSALVDETGSFTASTLASRVTKTLDLQGGALALDAANCSSLAALSVASQMLRSGACSTMICGAVHRGLDPVALESLALRGWLGGAEAVPGREPFVPGEGVAVVLLKRLEDAVRDGDTVLGTIKAVGFGNDPGELNNAATAAAGRAVAEAGNGVTAVERIHIGYGLTPPPRELEASLERQHGCRPEALPLVNQIGFVRAAHGLVSLIHATLPSVMESRSGSPGTIAVGIRSSNGLAGELLFDDSVPRSTSSERANGSTEHVPEAAVASDSFSRSAAATPSSFSTPRSSSSDMTRILQLGAPTRDQLITALERHDVASGSSNGSYEEADRHRLVVVANGESVEERLRFARTAIEKPDARTALHDRGIFYFENSGEPQRVAFLFPGQGSQFPGMFHDLLEISPAARELIAEADDILRRRGEPIFAELTSGAGASLECRLWENQIAVLLGDSAMYAALEERGIVPDVVTGHSYGEFAALVAAGVWTLEQAIRITDVRTRAVLSTGVGATGMLAVRTSADVVESLAAERFWGVQVTHLNSPEETVVGGTHAALEEFRAELAKQGIAARLLQVPCAFHTPLLAGAAAPLRRALDRERLLPPRIPLLSGVTGRYIADPEDIRASLVTQLTEPVRHTKIVRRLADDGVGVFVEVGPRQVLTRLTRATLNGSPSVCISSDHSARPVDAQLSSIRAVWDGLGAPRRTAGPVVGSTASAVRMHASPAVASPAPKSAATEADHFDATADRRNRRRQQSQGAQPAPASRPSTPAVTPAPVAEPRSNGASSTVPAVQTATAAEPTAVAKAETPAMSTEALAAFLIDFVVEQTGYPVEVVDLDADLEADLGIDSIKKAQLFGELREIVDFGDIGPGQFSLADFPTLRHVLDLASQAGSASAETSAPVAEAAGMAASPTPIVPEPATAPAPTFAEPKPRAEIPPTPAERPSAPPSPSVATVEANVPSDESLEQFLIDFVIEQTGYPPEVVSLDADLEADLGIDSIKKAQLFGELREIVEFDDSIRENFSLADFQTLRQVLEVTKQAASTGGSPRPVAESVSVVEEPRPAIEDRRTTTTVESPAASTAFARGVTVGREHAVEIRAALREMVDVAVESPAARLDPAVRFSPEDIAEANGIAEGAGVHEGSVMAYALRADTSGDGALADLLPWGNPPATREAPTKPVVPTVDAPATSETAEELDESITQRYVLRMGDAPLRTGGPTEPTFAGDTLILGDGPVAEALAARLEQSGVRAHRIKSGDEAEVANQLDAVWQQGPIPHVFLATPHDPNAAPTFDAQSWTERRQRGVKAPFALCQRWYQLVLEAGLMEEATIVGLLSLGGDFGFTAQPSIVPESGAIAGLSKAIFIERWTSGYHSVPIKLIDFPAGTAPAEVVEAVWQEMATPTYETEVAWHGGRRRAVRTVPQTVPAPSKSISRGGTWVCTGGGRGITARIAREIGVRYGARLHLVGTAPEPDVPVEWLDLDEAGTRELKRSILQSARAEGQNSIRTWQRTEKAIEITRTLADLEALGIAATYHQCDVSDREALARTLDAVRRIDGPITGILHGAGVGQDARFDRKNDEKVEQCISAKIDGALALMSLTESDPLEYFIGFGSISGRFGANGHTDYSLSNDALAKTTSWFRSQRPEVTSLTFHWHAWGDVGMATKPETKLALEAVDMQFMPVEEGLAHLFAELEAGAPEPEVLITDDRRFHAFCTPGDEATSSNGRATRPRFPLLAGEGENGVFTALLDPMRDPFLFDHKLADRPLLPLVVGMELLCEAAVWSGALQTPLTLRNVEAISGLRFHSDRPQTVRVRTTPGEGGSLNCELVADVLTRDGRLVQSDRPYLRAVLEPAALQAESRPQFDAGTGEWHAVEYPPEGSQFYSGPSLRCLRRIRFEPGRAVGRILAPALNELAGFRRCPAGWILPSAVIDACLYAAGGLAWQQIEPGAALPVGIGKLRQGRPPVAGEPCLVSVRIVESGAGRARFDFQLTGDNGDLLLDATDYEVAWLK